MKLKIVKLSLTEHTFVADVDITILNILKQITVAEMNTENAKKGEINHF